MVDSTEHDEGFEVEGLDPEDLTPEEEQALLSDTRESNADSDYPDPEQDFDPDEIDEEPDYETED